MNSKIIKSKKRIKVLITGASGFVGSKILKALIHENAEITLVLRDSSSPKEKIMHSIKKVIYSDDIFSESVDWWVDSCHDVDVVVHSAWYAEPGKYLKSMKNLNCLEGSVRLAKGAAKAGVKHFVGIGTCFEYAMSNKPLDVYSKLFPLTLYASSKLSLYYLLKEFLRLKDIKFTWCRLFYLYGDGEDHRRFIPYLKNQLKNGEVAELTSGKKVRDFMDVEDAGKVITKTIVHSQDGVVNVCSGKPVTIREMAEKIADKYGRRELLKFGAREDNLIDPDYVVGIPNII
tara:strand:- start:923 stop:1786 length:864 start_codon:yes stop_codon:yes gene_type:complete